MRCLPATAATPFCGQLRSGACGRTRWSPGERVRYYRVRGGGHVWLPDDAGDPGLADRRDYDVEHYVNVLVSSYASRLRKAFAPEDFVRVFQREEQLGFFDRPVASIEPLWIRCAPRG